MAIIGIMQASNSGTGSARGLPVPNDVPGAQKEQRALQGMRPLLKGEVVAVAGHDRIKPVADVLVELHVLDPLQIVARALAPQVLAHIRALLRGAFSTVDLYQHAGYVCDTPTVSIADINSLTGLPGFELLARASRSRSDAAFRQMLCNYPAILRPLLCYYHPGSFSSQHIATAASDHRGTFQFPVPRSEDSAEPGYYFIVRRQISRNLFATLYEPMPVTWHVCWRHSHRKFIDEELIRLTTRHPMAICS